MRLSPATKETLFDAVLLSSLVKTKLALWSSMTVFDNNSNGKKLQKEALLLLKEPLDTYKI